MAPRKVPGRTHVELLTYACLSERKKLLAVLDALRAAGFDPMTWGITETDLTPWDRDAAIAEALSRPSRVLYLARSKVPRYTGGLYVHQKPGLASFGLVVTSTHDGRDVFALGDHLARELAPLYGFVHPIYEKEREWNRAGGIQIVDFESMGLAGVPARTYYGPEMVQLFGRERLLGSAGEVEDLGLGALRIDVVPRPWTAPFTVLARRQREAHEALAPAGLFADYSHPLRHRAALQWADPPTPFDSLRESAASGSASG